MEYHKNYYEEGASHRGGLDERLDAILDVLDEKYILDVGCSGGYYDFGLYEATDPKYILAIDTESDLIARCQDIQANNFVDDRVEFRVENLEDYIMFPSAKVENGEPNACLYMSVHHHMIQRYGMDLATFMLRVLCHRFDRVIFDMGQKSEDCPSCKWWHELPDNVNQQRWLEDYLLENTGCDIVEVIGKSTVHGTDRYLFNLE